MPSNLTETCLGYWQREEKRQRWPFGTQRKTKRSSKISKTGSKRLTTKFQAERRMMRTKNSRTRKKMKRRKRSEARKRTKRAN